MKTHTLFTFTALTLILGMFIVQPAKAHCDRENGPVAVAAKKALKTGDFSKVAIWVGKQQEEELRKKFLHSRKVYQSGDESRQLAKQYFMETAVRLHRQAEGMPYTGLKPAKPAARDIQVAEKALETGNLEPVMQMFSNTMQQEAHKWFEKALKAKANKGKSVEAGREWADLYVKYIVYLHKLYQTIEQGPPHGVGE